MRRRLLLLALVAVCAAAAILAFARAEARRDPVVRDAQIALPRWPTGAAPVRVALLADIHIGNAAMDAARLGRIVDRVNALSPDLVLIAGDLIAGHEEGSAARLGDAMVAPLARLRAPLGAYAALGNHDHWTGEAAVRAQLARAGVRVIDNGAVTAGPLALGVVDDDYTKHDDVPATLAAMRALPGARLLLTHSPDVAPSLPADIPLLLAGHTHCGQIVLPLVGALATPSRYGERYRCGIVRERGRTVIVTAGVGTSVLPLRLGAPPDLWLLTLGPAQSRTRR